MHLILDYPWYFVLLCLLAGVSYSALLYFRNRSFERKTLWLLSVLRGCSVAAIAFLFLAPLVKRNVNQSEKPIIVVAHDNSQSPLYCKDSALYQGNYADNMAKVIANLSKDYDVQCYTYGSTVTPTDSLPTYCETSTDIASLIAEVAGRYQNRNVGALLLTGDGIANQGFNPVNSAEQCAFPIYTVALGDTMPRRDAAVVDIRYNRIAYLGNQFPIEITVRATQLKGEGGTLSVAHNGTVLHRQPLQYNSENFSTTVRLVIDANREGLQHYDIALTPCNDEITARNNRRTIAVEVLNGEEKIAIVAAAPHPDVAALRQSISQNRNHTVEAFLARDAKIDVKDYNLVILHNLPTASGEGVALASQLRETHTPTLFIVGSHTDLPRLNSLHCGVEIHTKLSKQNEVVAVFNSKFSHFTLDETVWHAIEQMPPLTAPFGDYRLSANTQVLFYARIGNVESQQPVMAFTQQQATRYGFIIGEGLWRWRLSDYQTTQTHHNFDALVSKALLFTSLKVDKEQFHVTMKNIYRENEAVVAEAELYNNNYEPINDPEASLTLYADAGKAKGLTYQFNRSGNGYALNLGTLASGTYRYSATTHYGGKELKATGSFLVEDLNMEENNLVANHALMNTLATTTGGEMLMPADIGRLPYLLRQRDDIKSVIYTHTRYTELLNLPLIFILIVLLLGVEWVLRKYNGTI